MEVKTVGVACDHAGFALKQFVLQYLEEKGYPVKDYGTWSDASVDYPDFGHALAEGIESGEVYPGIAICGSGEGISITLNKHQHVRVPTYWLCQVVSSTIIWLVRLWTSSSPQPSKVVAIRSALIKYPYRSKIKKSRQLAGFFIEYRIYSFAFQLYVACWHESLQIESSHPDSLRGADVCAEHSQQSLIRAYIHTLQ